MAKEIAINPVKDWSGKDTFLSKPNHLSYFVKEKNYKIHLPQGNGCNLFYKIFDKIVVNIITRAACIVALLFLIANHSYSQNISGLEGKKLTKLDDIGSAIGSIFGTQGLTGEINEVLVIQDSEKKLAFTLNYTGFETGYLRIRALNGDKSSHAALTEIEKDLTDVKGPLDFELLLKEDTKEGISFESPFLEVKVSKSKSNMGGKIFLYSLNKKWQENIKAENLLVNIKPSPIGKASLLKSNEEKVIVPGKNQRFLLQNSMKASTVAASGVNREVYRVHTNVNQPAVTKPAIDGTWLNADANTRGLTKIIISKGGTNIQAFGKCSPNDCDWGVKVLSKYGNGNFRAVYDQGFATSIFNIQSVNNQLKLQEKRTYKNNRPQVNSSYTFNRQNFVVYIEPKLLNYYPLALNKDEVDKGAQGPADNPLSLWEDLKTDVDFESSTEITNIRMDIYEDKNPASGIYYYLPASYHLKWNEDNGFGIRFLYGTGTDSQSGNVRIASTLTPNISTREIDFITDLIKSHIAKYPGKKFEKLRLVPLQEIPKISFASELSSQYQIPADKVSVNVTSSIKEPIEVSWITDSRTKQEMQVALLENVGIQGTMTLIPQSESVVEQQIPVRITLADQRTLGRFDFDPHTWRNNSWRNKTPYPVKLKKLHMLLLENQNGNTIPLIYSWNLEEKSIPPTAGVQFDYATVPAWLDGRAKRIWVEYSIVPCEACDNQIIKEITGGTSGSEIKNITFETFKVIENTGAAFLLVKSRSIQGDPGGSKLVEFPALKITTDNHGQTTGPIYVPEGKELDVEYFLTAVMPDGEVYKADKWVKASETDIYLGINHVREAIPLLPQNTTSTDINSNEDIPASDLGSETELEEESDSDPNPDPDADSDLGIVIDQPGN